MTLKDDPCFSVQVEITVPFHDADAMGVVWHGNYFRYFEVAREALLKQFNYGYRQMRASGYVWPIVDTKVKYSAPLQFEQRVQVRAQLEEFENRLRISYQIFDAESGKRTTTGYTIQVAVDEKTQEMCFASPQILLDNIGDLS
jgi:acyl-CoA thioester hydrolase